MVEFSIIQQSLSIRVTSHDPFCLLCMGRVCKLGPTVPPPITICSSSDITGEGTNWNVLPVKVSQFLDIMEGTVMAGSGGGGGESAIKDSLVFSIL